MLPRSRHYMHLGTVMTMVDRDAVTLFPEVVDGARVWSIRPGEAPDLPVVERFAGDVIDALEQALGVGQMRVIPTGGYPFGSEREQWDDGNNLLCLEPGVVIAYDRNIDTNTRLRKAGIEVITIFRIRARTRPRRVSLHELPNPTRPRLLGDACTTCAIAASSRRSTSPRESSSTCSSSRRH